MRSTRVSARQHTRQQQLEALDKDIDAVRNGSHKLYVAHLKALQEEHKAKREDSRRKNKRKLDDLQAHADAEAQELDDEFKSAQTHLRERMLDEMNAKRRRLDAKGSSSSPLIHSDTNVMLTDASSVGKVQASALLTRKKYHLRGVANKEVQFRNIKWTLNYDEINQDLTRMRRHVGWKPPAPHEYLGEFSVTTYQGELRYFDRKYRLSDTLKAKLVHGNRTKKIYGAISFINGHHIILRKSDGMDVCITLADLRSGRWKIARCPPKKAGVTGSVAGAGAASSSASSSARKSAAARRR